MAESLGAAVPKLSPLCQPHGGAVFIDLWPDAVLSRVTDKREILSCRARLQGFLEFEAIFWMWQRKYCLGVL